MLKHTNISNYWKTGTPACRQAWSPFCSCPDFSSGRNGDKVVNEVNKEIDDINDKVTSVDIVKDAVDKGSDLKQLNDDK